MGSNDNVIIAASYYTRRVFLSPALDGLPSQVKNELKAAAALAAENARGILTVSLKSGEVSIGVEREGDDFSFDEINAKAAVGLFIDNQAKNLNGVKLYLKYTAYE